jgi:PAS domain S-box-containing protein
MKSDRPFLEEAPEVTALEDSLTRGGLGCRPRPEFATGDARFRAYVEYAPVAMFVLDAEGRYVDFNPATLTLLGTDDTTLITQTFVDAVAEADRSLAEQHLDTLQAAGQLEAEQRLRRADGTEVWVFLRATRLGDTRFLAVAEDITERKRAQQEMCDLNASLARQVAERAAELSATNQELEAFCYSVSHDLRAPVRAMDGFSQALMEDFGPQLPETGQQYVQKIRRGAQRLGQLIDDLLAFSRLNRAPLSWEEVDHPRFVKEALEDLRPQRQGRRIEIRVGDLPPCQGDPTLLKQVWHHLIGNALKFTRPRKKAQVEIGCETRADQTVYFVKDNGVGFDMRYAHKLFSAFQRLHRTEEFEGTGMGLAMVHRILQRHGGRIWVEAAVDHGATFFFTLNEGTLHA